VSVTSRVLRRPALEPVRHARVPSVAVHASNEVEFRRVDVALVCIQNRLLGDVNANNFPQHKRLAVAQIDLAEQLAFKRSRALANARRMELCRRHGVDLRKWNLAYAAREVHRSSRHGLSVGEANQIDHELAVATDVDARVLQ